jgi:hypothetical protein
MQRAALLLLGAAAAVSFFAPPAAAQPQPPRTVGSFPSFPYLLHPQEPDRSKWHALGQMIWEDLKQFDFDFVDPRGNVVPPGIPGAKPVAGVACGRVSRLWVSCYCSQCVRDVWGCWLPQLACNLPVAQCLVELLLSADLEHALPDCSISPGPSTRCVHWMKYSSVHSIPC